MELSQKPEVRDLIREEIRKGNEALPASTRIRRFLLLTKDLEADDAEMTRTRKLRRPFVAEKSASVLDPFYPPAPAVRRVVAFGFALERGMLRGPMGGPVIAGVRATIGLASILRGVGPLVICSGTKPLPLPIGDEPFMFGPLFIPPIQLLGAGVSLAFLAGFGWFFLKSRKGIAMRAVADNQQVAMAMGIDVERYFGVAWAMTGIVSALGGILWGNLLGVDVNLALVGFKVFPVVILGGLDSIPGAIVGGLIVGIVENMAAGYVDPYVGGGTKDFAPYVLMIAALMVRPYGIFGKKIIERI